MKRTVYRSLTLVLFLSGLFYAAAQGPQAALPCEESPVPVPCTAVATQASNLALVTQLSDIVGIWRLYVPQSSLNTSSSMAYQRINRDGSFSQTATLETTATPYGTYSFDGGVLVLTLESQSSPPGCEMGRFEARLYRYGAQPVALLLTPIEDNCPSRTGNLPLIWVAQAD